MRPLLWSSVLLAPGLAWAQPAPSYSAGAADRTAYEDWFAGLSGDYRTGVEFWVTHRSLPKEATCLASGKAAGSDWMLGCQQAQQRFTPLDARRKSDPDYRLGWNSFQPREASQAVKAGPTAGSAATDIAGPLHGCYQLASATSRLDCYDKLAAGVAAPPASSPALVAVPPGPPLQEAASREAAPVPAPARPAPPTPETAPSTAKPLVDGADLVSKEDQDHAAKMGVSVANFLAAKAKHDEAALLCQQAAADAATYGSRKDWLPNNSWYLAEGKLVTVGKDLQVKNAFNAQRYVTYACKFDMLTGKTELVGME